MTTIFGYKEVATLFYDSNKDTLFTLPMAIESSHVPNSRQKTTARALLMNSRTDPPSPVHLKRGARESTKLDFTHSSKMHPLSPSNVGGVNISNVVATHLKKQVDNLGTFTGGLKPVMHDESEYRFKMVDEMRFTDEEVIRMNITLGITGDMFKSNGLFFTDFLLVKDSSANTNNNTESRLAAALKARMEKERAKANRRLNHIVDSSDDSDD